MMHPVLAPRRGLYRRGYDPFEEMARMMAAFGRGGDGWTNEVDVDEDESGWTVTIQMPGMAPDDIDVEVQDRELRIKAKTEASEGNGNGDKARRVQRRAFDYELDLPGEVDAEQVTANMENGLLTIRLPRSAQSRRRSIQIKAGSGTRAIQSQEDQRSNG